MGLHQNTTLVLKSGTYLTLSHFHCLFQTEYVFVCVGSLYCLLQYIEKVVRQINMAFLKYSNYFISTSKFASATY